MYVNSEQCALLSSKLFRLYHENSIDNGFSGLAGELKGEPLKIGWDHTALVSLVHFMHLDGISGFKWLTNKLSNDSISDAYELCRLADYLQFEVQFVQLMTTCITSRKDYERDDIPASLLQYFR